MTDYRQEELYRGELLYLASNSPEDLREIGYRGHILRSAKQKIEQLNIPTIAKISPNISPVISPEVINKVPELREIDNSNVVSLHTPERPDLKDYYDAVEEAYKAA
jgi:hypothetical protein